MERSKEELKRKAAKLVENYSEGISSEDLMQEINHIRMVHNANLVRTQLDALELLNVLAQYILESIFPNLCVNLRVFLSAPATVASSKIILIHHGSGSLEQPGYAPY